MILNVIVHDSNNNKTNCGNCWRNTYTESQFCMAQSFYCMFIFKMRSERRYLTFGFALAKQQSDELSKKTGANAPKPKTFSEDIPR